VLLQPPQNQLRFAGGLAITVLYYLRDPILGAPSAERAVARIEALINLPESRGAKAYRELASRFEQRSPDDRCARPARSERDGAALAVPQRSHVPSTSRGLPVESVVDMICAYRVLRGTSGRREDG
jgi:hypothetical protein